MMIEIELSRPGARILAKSWFSRATTRDQNTRRVVVVVVVALSLELESLDPSEGCSGRSSREDVLFVKPVGR